MNDTSGERRVDTRPRWGRSALLLVILLIAGLTDDAFGQSSGLGDLFKGLGGNGNAEQASEGVDVAAMLRRGGVVKITPKPFAEPPSRSSERAMARGVEDGVIPAGATALENHRLQAAGGRMIERQISPEVCWAACSQMVLAAQGCEISQEKLVEVFRGNLGLLRRVEKPAQDFAGLEEICKVLERAGRKEDGRETILATPFEKSLHGAVQDLAEGRPVIAGLGAGDEIGHAYVITAMTVGFYTVKQAGWEIIQRPDKLVEKLLRSPWTYDFAAPATVSKDQVDLIALAGIKPDMLRYKDFYLPQGHPYAGSFIVLFEVTLADPYPDNPAEVTMTADEFKQRLRFLIRVRHQP
ncbi:MAG TPA: papain-like cysteine protease family protein [Verrucomicrobiota bacterium]|nr:papain-like cysteine protease family protein [Verrucomicrobiota bacterium]